MVEYYNRSKSHLGKAGAIFDQIGRGHLGSNYTPSAISSPTAVGPGRFSGVSDPAMQQFFQSLIKGNDGRSYLEALTPRDTATRSSDITGAMSPFMNQFDDQVINQALTRMGEARDMTMSEIGAGASQAGAFGGSRHALLEAKANEDYMRNAGELTSNLKQQSFSQALQAAMGVDQASDAYGLNYAGTMMQGEGMDLQTSLAQFNAMLQGNQLNLAGDNTDLNRAQLVDSMLTNRDSLRFQQDQLGMQNDQFNVNSMLQAALGHQGIAGTYYDQVTNQEDRMWAQGAAQQQVNQGVLDAAYQQFQSMMNDPYRAIELMGKVTSTDPRLNNYTGTGTTKGENSQSTRPGFFDYLSLGLQGFGAGIDAGIWGG